MKNVDFRKYSVNGNTFVFLDETDGPILTEAEKSRFASPATDINFGIGADNLITIQPCTSELLETINKARNYWKILPDCGNADFIFRMFEPSGKEAFSCGNGLMCAADHLYRHRGKRTCRIMTQIPMETPRVVTIGVDMESGMNWANLGFPRKIPPFIVATSGLTPLGNNIYGMKDLSVVCHRTHDHTEKKATLTISGYLIFTGEPHLIIFTDTGLSIGDISDDMFSSENHRETRLTEGRRRGTYSTWLVHNIGMHFNQSNSAFFPYGVNVTFVHIVDSKNTLEYRSFERGINHETLACGTGAVAASVVSRELGLCSSDELIVWPHRCRWYSPNTQYSVRRNDNDWYIYGNPHMLYQGKLAFG
jgi:diaminopimelate epimerase